jgi:hypothetical protein
VVETYCKEREKIILEEKKKIVTCEWEKKESQLRNEKKK